MNIMDLTQWMTVISNFGFPICITLYVLLRIEKKLDKLNRDLLKERNTNRKRVS